MRSADQATVCLPHSRTQQMLGAVAGPAQATAVVGARRSFTFAELETRVAELAAALAEVHRGDERPVAACVARDADLVALLLACLRAGVAYLPIDLSLPRARIARMFELVPPAMVLADASTAVELAGLNLEPAIVQLAHLTADRGGRCIETVDHSMKDLAYVLFTSGSTGEPRAVGVARGGLAAFLAAGASLGWARPGDRMLAATTTTFDIAAVELLLPPSVGATVVMLDDDGVQRPDRFVEAIERERVTVAQATPSMWRLALGSGLGSATRRVRALCGGEELPMALASALASSTSSLTNLYGPTEATVWATSGAITGDGSRVHLGRPIPGWRVHVLDDLLQPVPFGARGELCIGGDGVARGYLGRPRTTAERFVPDPFGQPGDRLYRTGDVATVQRDGTFAFHGRCDSQVKLRGHRIELGEVEAAIGEQPDVASCAVVTAADGAGGHRLVAAVTGACDGASVRSALRDRLPASMIPAVVVVLDELPMLRNGKVDRTQLAHAIGNADVETLDDDGPEHGGALGAVCRVFADVLQRRRVRPDDNFFDLGGHSLLALQITARIEAVFGRRLPLAAVFDQPTPAGLAVAVVAADVAAEVEIPTVDRAAPLAVSRGQRWMLTIDRALPPGALHMRGIVRFAGDVSEDALVAALRFVVDRHEILRTRYPRRSGVPLQEILPPGTAEIEVVDLRDAAPSTSPAFVARHREILATLDRRRNLARELPHRFVVARTADDAVWLYTLVHHIAFDGRSRDVFLTELATAYDALVDGRAPVMAPVAVQYADFAAWQNTALAGDASSTAIAYWQRKLADPPSIDLGAALGGGDDGDAGYGVREFRVPASATDGLHRVAAACGASMFMTALAVFHSAVRAAAGNPDVAVAYLTANRPVAQLADTIGVFTNTLVMRVDGAAARSFADLLRAVRNDVLEANEHQAIAPEDLMSPMKRTGGRADLAILFQWEPQTVGTLKLARATIDAAPSNTDVPVEAPDQPVELQVLIGEDVDGALRGQLVHARRALSERSAETLARRFVEIAAAVSASPGGELDAALRPTTRPVTEAAT